MSGSGMGCAIVTHQSAGVIDGLLDSLHLLRPEMVVVVDHASTDGTPEALRRRAPDFPMTLLERPNRGYAAGANAALETLRSHGVEIVALLNPDARLLAADTDGIRDLFDSRPDLGSACPLTLAADGVSVDTLGLRLTPWAAVADHGQGTTASWVGTAPIPGVIGPCGGSALYRAAALASIRGPFDERFFLYFEDADVALRLRARGWSTVTTDLLSVQHRRAGLGGRADDLSSRAARRAAVERQKSYELFVSGAAPLPVTGRLLGRAAAALRGRLVSARLRRVAVGGG